MKKINLFSLLLVIGLITSCYLNNSSKSGDATYSNVSSTGTRVAVNCTQVVGKSDKFTTIQAAVNDAVTKGGIGQTICVRPDKKYNEGVKIYGSGSKDKPLILTAHPESAGNFVITDTRSWPIQKTPNDQEYINQIYSARLFINGNYVVVRRLEIDRSTGCGIYLSGGGNNLVENCFIHNTWNFGLIAEKSSYNIVRNSWFMDTVLLYSDWGRMHHTLGWSAGVTFCHESNYNLVENSTIAYCWGEALSTFSADFNTFRNNVLYENSKGNIYLDNTTGSIADSNAIFALVNPMGGTSPSGISVCDENAFRKTSQGRQRKIVNNLIVGTSRGICFWGCEGGITPCVLRDDLIANNTFVNTSTDRNDYHNLVITGYTDISNVLVANNLVLAKGGQTLITPIQGITVRNNIFSSVPIIKSNDQRDNRVVSQSFATILVNPYAYIINSASFKATNYQLNMMTSNIAVNSGYTITNRFNIPEVKHDLWGNQRPWPQQGNYDIGAHEYLSQSFNQPPVVSISAPQNGAQYTEGSAISITANASDSDGTVTRVEFFQGTTKLGEDTSAPYAYTWSNVPAGSYALTAVAYDDDRAHTASTPVGITVNPSGGAITVTESSHDGSDMPQNTLDNNLGTKWSADGIGQWVQYDLRSVKLIDSVEMAFYRGTEIVYYFDIEVSNNGTTWTKVYTGQNSKQTLNLELFAFAMTSARYVKIVGKGNWWHAWNRYTEVKVNSIMVSASAYDGTHVPAHTLDGDLNSYWSAWGIGEWIQYDLGKARIIDSVDIAFERGNIIKYYFDIEVSLNGVTWTKVYIGQNSGTTAGLELYDFAEVMARYVKIIGKGNMWHEWNRPTEVKINSIITSASSYDGTYVPENTLDGNLNSYWSAWGIGEWIQYDLQRTRTINSVELAFERGNVLVYSFDIEVSMDGASWTKVYTGQNSGTTLGLELFNFTDVSARYVKLVGKGNIWHEWNRPTEVKINKE